MSPSHTRPIALLFFAVLTTAALVGCAEPTSDEPTAAVSQANTETCSLDVTVPNTVTSGTQFWVRAACSLPGGSRPTYLFQTKTSSNNHLVATTTDVAPIFQADTCSAVRCRVQLFLGLHGTSAGDRWENAKPRADTANDFGANSDGKLAVAFPVVDLVDSCDLMREPACRTDNRTSPSQIWTLPCTTDGRLDGDPVNCTAAQMRCDLANDQVHVACK